MNENILTEETTTTTSNFVELLPKRFRYLRSQKVNPIDILEVFKFDRNLSENFLYVLQKGGTQYINTSADNRRLINQLYFDAQNQIKIKGQNNLAVVYPFFYEKRADGDIFSPLFYFRTDLEPETATTETWLFSAQRSSVVPNYHLFNYLEAQYGIDKAWIYSDIAQNPHFSGALKNTVEHIGEKVGFTVEFAANKIFPIQIEEGLANDLDEVGIYFNALIGNFEFPTTKNDAFIADSHHNSKNANEPYHYGLFNADVTQTNALATLQSPLQVVTGHAGTGKTHTIANLVSFALSKGKKIAIINDNQKALLQVQHLLERWNLEKFSFIIKNLDGDKTVLLDIMRAIADTIDEQEKKFNFKNFDIKTNSLAQAQTKLYEAYYHLQKEIAVGGNWQNLVGLSMLANQKVGKEVFAAHLAAPFFTLENEEFYELKALLTKAKHLYQPLNTLSHQLSNLDKNCFQQTDAKTIKTHIEDNINIAKYDFTHLYSIGNQVVERFKQAQTNDTQAKYLQWQRQAERLQDFIEENKALYGSRFGSPGIVQNWLGNFSQKGKDINVALATARTMYHELAQSFAQTRVMSFSFLKKENIAPQKMASQLKDFLPRLQEWHAANPKNIISNANALSFVNGGAYADEIKLFDENLTATIDTFNQANIYTQKFDNQATTLVGKLKLIDECLAKLEATEKEMPAFERFHAWQSFWQQTDQKEQHLIKGAIAAKNEHWEDAFESWYIDQLLQKNYADNLPQHTDFQKDIQNKYYAIVAELSQQIAAKSYQLRYETVAQYRKKSARFNTAFGKNNQTQTSSLAQLFAENFDAVTSCFPVVLTTVENAKSLFDGQKFDYLVIDDAQQIEKENLGNLLNAAKQVVVMGDPTEINEKQPSLLYWAMDKQLPKTTLSMIHTTKSDTMNLFLDAIYPSDSMRLPLVKETTPFVDVLNVMGSYDEQNNHNTAEAEQVLSVLNMIEKNNLGRYPSVGIITTTIEQRNLIANILLQLKQKRAAGFDKIMQLERNNLGIYHWSEIEGQKFDIAIFSLTFGIKDTKGKLTEEIQTMNSPKGFGYFYQTLTRANQKIIVCNSVPYSYFDEFYLSHTAKGTFLLSALFKYKQALQVADYEAQNTILQTISEGLGSVKNTQQSVLLQEIHEVLSQRIEDRSLTLLSQIGSLAVPLIISKKIENAPDVALRIDGTFTLPYTPDAVWEKNFEQQLEAAGHRIVDTWSVNWWRNKNGEVERLLQILENIDDEFLPKPIALIEEATVKDNDTADTEDEHNNDNITDNVEEQTVVDTAISLEELQDNQPTTIVTSPSEQHHDNNTRPSEA
jgi:AAA domain